MAKSYLYVVITMFLLMNYDAFTQLKSYNEVKEKECLLVRAITNGSFKSLYASCDVIYNEQEFLLWKYTSLNNKNTIKDFYGDSIYVLPSSYNREALEFLFEKKIKYTLPEKIEGKCSSDFGNKLIVYNKKEIQSDTNKCLSDGVFAFEVFKVEFKYVEYKKRHFCG